MQEALHDVPAFRDFAGLSLGKDPEQVQAPLSNRAKNAKWMNSKRVLSSLSQFLHSCLFFCSHAKLRFIPIVGVLPRRYAAPFAL